MMARHRPASPPRRPARVPASPPPRRLAASLVALLALLACGGADPPPPLPLHDAPPPGPSVAVLLPGAPPRHLAFADLLPLAEPAPAVPATLPDRTVLPTAVVPLARLWEHLRPDDADLLLADCADRYQARFTRDQIAAHAPFIVAAVDGQPFPAWAEAQGVPRYAPLFLALTRPGDLLDPIHKSPWGVVRLTFTRQDDAWAPVAAARAAHPRGFQIYADVCLNCHALGDGPVGGRLSPRPLAALAARARADPAYVRHVLADPPAALRDPATLMPSFAHHPTAERDALLAFLAAVDEPAP